MRQPLNRPRVQSAERKWDKNVDFNQNKEMKWGPIHGLFKKELLNKKISLLYN